MGRIPTLKVLVGLPASGKSTYAKNQSAVIHSSDALREELFADVNCQERNEYLFIELHKRIKCDLSEGKDVAYDACNIDKKRRIAFLSELKNIPCHKKCVVFMTPYETCLEFNATRERKVPEEVIKRMYLRWCPPHYSEGFDDIEIIYNYGDEVNRLKYTIPYFFEGENGIDHFDQENSHHALTLGEHCRSAESYIKQKWPGKQLLHIAALLHDIGKVFTKSDLNAKGDSDGDCHYYNHQNVSSYLSFFFTDCMGLGDWWQLYVANLIYYHMHPYISWKQSEKALKKDRKRIGETMFNDVMLLHEADQAAH